MTATSVASAYPISAATARELERPLFGHFIDGQVVESLAGGTMPVIDPATGEQVATAGSGDAADVDRAAKSARAAFEDGRWRFLPPLEKERRLRRLATLLTERADVFIELDVIDCGFLRAVATYINQFSVDGIDYYAGWPSKLHGTVPSVPNDYAVYELKEPIGVVGAIVPWNGPTAGASMAVFALCTGNSVVLKPAEQTPMTSMLLAELAIEAGVPPGVFNVVQGTGESVGAALVEHPAVDSIFFTGSVQTGSAIQAAAAKQVKRVALELGGKSPVIVFPDADLELAAASAMAGIWSAAGEFCTCSTRVIVHSKVYDDVVGTVVNQSKDLKVGGGFDPDAQMGPLISAQQLERVHGYVSIGLDEGAQLALGGERVGDRGYFHQPTIFTDVRNDMRIAQEEIFGPVMSVLRFEGEEEVYRWANGTQYGLSAAVYTSDLARAHRAVRAIDAGTVWVNTYQDTYPSVSYGGVKRSGHGRMLGEAHLDELTRTKSVWMKVA